MKSEQHPIPSVGHSDQNPLSGAALCFQQLDLTCDAPKGTELNQNMQIKHLCMGCNLKMSVTKELPSSPSLGSHIFTSRLGKTELNIHVSEGPVHATFGEILTATDPCVCIIPEEIHGYTPTKPLTQTPCTDLLKPPARVVMAEKAAP